MEDLFLDLALLLGVGCLAGFLGGLLGIGGGIIMIPALFSLFEAWGVPLDQRVHIAVASSLVVIVIINSSSVRAHHKRKSVDWFLFKRWWLVIVGGSVLGAHFAQYLDGVMLIYIFSVFAVFLAVKMMLPLDHIQLGSDIPKGLTGYFFPFCVGFVSAVMGIGGGSLHVPYMTMYGVKIQRAVGTAALLGLVIAISGGASFLFSTPPGGSGLSYRVGYVHLPSVLALSVASFFLAPLGASLAHHLSKRILSLVFGVFLTIATARLLYGVL